VIWKIKLYSKWLIFTGIFLLLAFALLSVLMIPVSGSLEIVTQIAMAMVLIYFVARSWGIVLNPVLLRLDDKGAHLRGNIFIPYEDVLAFTKEKRWFAGGGCTEIYKLILRPSTTVPLIDILFKTKFILMGFKDKNSVISIVFPSSYTTDPGYEEVLGEMFKKYRNKTGNILSSNYYPDLYAERNV
jgi:hypothetical protein